MEPQPWGITTLRYRNPTRLRRSRPAAAWCTKGSNTTMKPIKSRQKNQRGSALIEFALCSVLLLMITCGTTEFARMITLETKATGAAEAGTQYGALSPAHWSDFTGMQTAALNDIPNASGATVTAVQKCYCTLGGDPVTCPADCGTPYTYVQVKVTIPYTPVFAYPMIPSTTSLSSVSTVRVQ